ncbi:MAG: ferredoxin [Mycobacteriales bacterium]
MGLHVEIERCVGTGQCEMALPSVFTVSDDGVVEVDHAAAEDADPAALARAVKLCPTRTLALRA